MLYDHDTFLCIDYVGRSMDYGRCGATSKIIIKSKVQIKLSIPTTLSKNYLK